MGKQANSSNTEVRNYITDYPDIAELLPFVCEVARRHVDEGSQLALGVFRDPDGGNGHLSLYIRPERYSKKLFDIIDRIEAEYIDKLVGKSGWLIVTTDFRAPE